LFYQFRYAVRGIAAAPRGTQRRIKQKGPASNREKSRKKYKLNHERRVNAFLLKEVISQHKTI